MDLETTLLDSLKYYGYNPEDIYFQQDKDPKHTSKLAKQWFVDNNFTSDHIYSWPAQSPDLNPIEHPHSLRIGRVMESKVKKVQTLGQLVHPLATSSTTFSSSAVSSLLPASSRRTRSGTRPTSRRQNKKRRV
ncbi:hypothetical protein G6F43_013131 [Rhizopus delemar]|nr:hypothetical protein G6F43_013131 [Rhizopus delemar]